MATNYSSADATPAGQGCKYSLVAGTAGVTAGDAVKLDSAGDVVDCNATTDEAIGIALTTASDGEAVTVLGNGCIIESNRLATAYSLTAGARSGITVTTGIIKDWASSGTYMGFALSTTKVLIQIQI